MNIARSDALGRKSSPNLAGELPKRWKTWLSRFGQTTLHMWGSTLPNGYLELQTSPEAETYSNRRRIKRSMPEKSSRLKHFTKKISMSVTKKMRTSSALLPNYSQWAPLKAYMLYESFEHCAERRPWAKILPKSGRRAPETMKNMTFKVWPTHAWHVKVDLPHHISRAAGFPRS